MTDRADIPDEELIATAIAGALLDLHTALPGIVKSYNPSTGSCDVLPAVKRALPREDGSTAFESLPVIPNVRVCWPGAGGFELHLPLANGDTVWLMFAEADIQKWESTGQESPPGWLERHGLGSLVAYPFSRTPKATTGGARLVAPTPFSVGDSATAKLLAIAELVEEQLLALKDAISGAAVSAGDGGATFKSNIIAALSAWPATTACSKLKAE